MTKSKLGTASVLNEPLRQEPAGCKLGSRRARVVEQFEGILGDLAGRRVRVKKPYFFVYVERAEYMMLIGKFLRHRRRKRLEGHT